MKNLLSLIFVGLFSLSVSTIVVPAQNYDLVADSLAFVTASWKVTPLEKGGSAMYAQVNMFNSVQSVSVVKYPAKKFQTEILHRPGETAATPSAVGKELGAAAVMNGGYFHVKERIPSVFFKKGKQILRHTHPTELYRVNGVFGFKDAKGRNMVIAQCPDSVNYASVTRKMKSAMATGPLLILDDEIVVPELMGDKADGENVAAMKAEQAAGSKIRTHYTSAQFYDRRHPRTAIGKDDSGNIYLVVIDGRFKGKADGASIFETAYICHLLGMTDAINLDGGGSTTMYIKGRGVVNHACDGKNWNNPTERAVNSIIYLK